jgi:hypothetical protein
MACYACNPNIPIKDAICHRHHHRGCMAEYSQALALVRHAIQTG